MLTYLSKKIALPNQRKVKSIAWSQEHGYIACGAENGLLKVLKLDDGGLKSSDLNLPKNLSMNQTLEGHNSDVVSVVWNERYEKLTSSDASGLIIVWMLYKGSWYEEMVNNRNKSIVVGMCWSGDGMKICIVYQDGAVIVGSVDGNRLWGKDIKSLKLTCVEWSPDSLHLLFGCNNGQVHIYDQTGNFVSKVSILENELNPSPIKVDLEIVTVEWFKRGTISHGLLIAFANGIIHMMENEYDEEPIIIDTKMTITHVSWNYYGSLFAVVGRLQVSESVQSNKVKFYDNNGTLAQTLNVSGKEATACSWEQEGLRLVIGADYYIFFANIRPDYMSCYFASTLVVALPRNLKTTEEISNDVGPTDTVVFCNLSSNSKQIKSIKNLTSMAAWGQYCVFSTSVYDLNLSATRSDSSLSPTRTPTGISDLKSSLYAGHSSLILCNSIGTPVDSVNVEIQVCQVAMNSTQVVAVSADTFVVWAFKTPSNQTNQSENSSLRLLDSDYRRTSSSGYYQPSPSNTDLTAYSAISSVQFVQQIVENDRIKCLAVSETRAIFGCESRLCVICDLNDGTVLKKIILNTKPSRIFSDLDSRRLAIIDAENVLSIIEISNLNSEYSANHKPESSQIIFEKKDVWDFCWSIDSPHSFAITEKSKLLIYCNLEADESIQFNGSICEFKDLVVRIILIDNLIMEFISISGKSIRLDEYFVEHEIKLLRETRRMLDSVGPADTLKFIESNSHPKLWRLMAESSLKLLDFKHSELALVKCKNYKGIQFAKRVSKISRDELKRAEVFAYFGMFDEAEKVYREFDRKNLAINLRRMIGDWSRVIKLLDEDSPRSRSDTDVKEALRSLGDVYMDDHNWLEAAKMYEECEAYQKLYECYCLLENYQGLKKVLDNVENPALLQQLGWTFEYAGLCSEAVKAYQKAKRVDLALKCCISHNEWKLAIDLAKERQVTDIDALLLQYSNHLQSKGRLVEVIELYVKANRTHDACNMLLNMLDRIRTKFLQNTSSNEQVESLLPDQLQISRNSHSIGPLDMKKAYLLQGLLYEHHSQAYSQQDRSSQTLESLLTDTSSITDTRNLSYLKAFDQPWKGAEAFHLFILVQRHLYSSLFDDAMKTALSLIDYDDFLETEDIYSLMALACLANKSYYLASKAFIKLESNESISEERRLLYQDLACIIFNKHPPKQAKTLIRNECKNCETLIPDFCTICPNCNVKFAICMASGRPIMDPVHQWTCRCCRHHALKSELDNRKNCPFCHTPIQE